MDDKVNDADGSWEYLSNVLRDSNSDDDLIAEEGQDNSKSAPRTNLEAQIQHIAEPDAELSDIKDLRPGRVHIHGQFTSVTGRYLRMGLHITEAIITDGTGSVRIVWWNQPYRGASLKRDLDYEIRGSYALKRSRFQISNSKIRPLAQGCKPFERGEKG